MSNFFSLQSALNVLCGIICLTDNCPLPQKHTFVEEILIKWLKLWFFQWNLKLYMQILKSFHLFLILRFLLKWSVHWHLFQIKSSRSGFTKCDFISCWKNYFVKQMLASFKRFHKSVSTFKIKSFLFYF